jgi:hypothetical protein
MMLVVEMLRFDFDLIVIGCIGEMTYRSRGTHSVERVYDYNQKAKIVAASTFNVTEDLADKTYRPLLIYFGGMSVSMTANFAQRHKDCG